MTRSDFYWVFKNMIICKRAVPRGWCKEGRCNYTKFQLKIRIDFRYVLYFQRVTVFCQFDYRNNRE